MSIQDAMAIKYIGISASMLSVPVNYIASAKPYITQIVNAAYVNSVPVIPTSVCIGIRRHTVMDSGMSIIFQSVNTAPKIINARVNDIVKGLCIIQSPYGSTLLTLRRVLHVHHIYTLANSWQCQVS